MKTYSDKSFISLAIRQQSKDLKHLILGKRATHKSALFNLLSCLHFGIQPAYTSSPPTPFV